MEKILLKIKRSNPYFPLAEYISKLKCCEFVDSISSEKIDGIAKLYVEKDELQELINNFKLKPEYIEPIEKSYNLEEKEGKLSFWLNFKIKRNNLSKLENFIGRQPEICEAYLTKNSIYIRAESNSIKDADELWRSLYKEIGDIIDLRYKVKTYFIFKRFKGHSV